jgi:hypothetical protein
LTLGIAKEVREVRSETGKAVRGISENDRGETYDDHDHQKRADNLADPALFSAI